MPCAEAEERGSALARPCPQAQQGAMLGAGGLKQPTGGFLLKDAGGGAPTTVSRVLPPPPRT